MNNVKEVKNLYFEILVFNYMKLYIDLLSNSKGSCLNKKSIFIPYSILMFLSFYLFFAFTIGSVITGIMLLILSPLLLIWVNLKYYNVKNMYMKISNSIMLEKIKNIIGNEKFNKLNTSEINLLTVLKVINEKGIENIPS